MPELPKVTQEFDADTGPFVASIQNAIDSLKAFTSQIKDTVAQVQVLNEALRDLPDTVTITLTMAGLTEAIQDVAALKAGLDSLHDRTVTTTIRTVYENVGTPLNNSVSKSVNQTISVPINNPSASNAGVVSELVDMGLGLPGEHGTSKGAFGNTASSLAQIIQTSGGLGVGGPGGSGGGIPNDLASLSSSISGLSSALIRVRSDAAGANSAINSMSNTSRNLYGWWRLLGKEVPLWAGVFGDNHLIGATQLWHVALDGLIEVTIALGEAAIGLGLAFAAMGPEAIQIGQHILAVREVTTSLGAAIPSITSNFDKLSHSMAPGVVEIYGGALNLLGHQGSVLNEVVGELVHGFDAWVAKLDVFAGAQGRTGALLHNSVEVLHQFEQILDNVGIAIANLMKADPGTVHYLLDFVVGATKLLDVITSLPSPILKAALALHAIDLWGGLAATAIVKMIGPTAGLISLLGKIGGGIGLGSAAASVDDFGRALRGMPSNAEAATMSEKEVQEATLGASATFQSFTSKIVGFAAANPWLAIAAAVITAMALTVTWILKAKSTTDDWVTSVNNAVNHASDLNQINTTVQALGANTEQLSKAQQDLTTKTGAWSALASGAQQNVSALAAQHRELSKDLFTETTNVGYLATKYGVDVPTAISYATAAGVKLTTGMTGQSNAAQVARQQIQNLITGYQNLGQQGSQVSADINAATIANSGQLASVQKLNAAWTTTIGLASGMQTAFLTFEQGLTTVQTDAKAAGASFDGINGASLQLRSDFEANISTMATSLGSLNTALSFGGLSWNQYRQSVATMVGEMLHAGNLSNAQKSQLGEIATAAGYTGTSYSSLSGWVGKFGGSEQGLNGIMDQATIAMANQKTIVGELQGTLQTSVINTTANAVLTQGGFQKALSNTYDALQKGGTSSKEFKDDLAKVDQTLKAAGFSTTQISQYNVALEKSFTAAGGGADTLGQKTGKLNGSFDQTKIKSDGLRDQIKNVFIAIGHYAEDYTDAARQSVIKGWDAVVSFLSGVWGGVKGVFVRGWGDVVNFTKSAWSGIYSTVHDWWTNTLNFIKSLATQFDGWWKTHGQALEEIWNAVWQGIKSIAEAYWHATTTVISQGWTILKGMFDAAIGVIKSMWDAFWNFLKADVEFFWNGVKPIVELGWSVLRSIFGAAISIIKGVWQVFWDTLKLIAEDIWAAIVVTVKLAWDDLVGIFNIFIDLLTGHWKTMWQDIKNLGVQNWNAIKQFFQTAWDNFHTYASNLFHTIGTDIVGGLKKGIMSAASAIGNFVKTYLVNPIINAVKHFFGIASPSTVMAEMGGHLVSGLAKGLEHSPDKLIGDAFGSWPKALEALVKKGSIDVTKLGSGALKALGKIGGDVGSFFHNLFSSSQANSHLGGSAAANQALGKQMAASIGWTGAQWDALNSVEMAEAGWSTIAQNPSSGAYGIAQFINGPSEYAQYGGTSTSASGQIAGFLDYIIQRYGNPEAAWAHEQAFHWYDQGGLLMPGLTMAYNGTGQPEHVISPSGAGAPSGDLHVHMNIDGKEFATAIYPGFQQTTYQKNVRNNGIGGISGAVRPGP